MGYSLFEKWVTFQQSSLHMTGGYPNFYDLRILVVPKKRFMMLKSAGRTNYHLVMTNIAMENPS